MNVYIYFLIATLIATPVVFIISKMIFKKSIVIIIFFLTYVLCLTYILIGIVFGDKGPFHLLWGAPLCGIEFVAYIIIIFKFLNNPLSRIVAKIDTMANYDIKGRITSRYLYEFSNISGSLNNHLTYLNSIIRNIKTSNNTLVNTNSELAAALEETSASIREIQSHISNMTKIMQILDKEIQISDSLSNDIRENVKKSVEQINNQTAEITDSSSAIAEMDASVHNVENTVVSKLKIVDSLVKIAKEGEKKNKRK